MSDQFIGTDVSSILESKKQNRLFTDLPNGKILNVGTFFSHLLGWIITRILAVLSFILGFILGFEKAIINLRLDTLQLFYWGRGNVFALFSQAILLFVLGAIAFTWIIGQGLTPRIVQEYASQTPAVVYAASNTDVVYEAGSLVTSLPKNLQRVDTEEYTVTYGDTVGGNTLANIADAWGVSADSIRWANNFSKGYQPKAGATIKIPPMSGSLYVVQANESLDTIASRFKINSALLAEVNFLDDPYTVHKGQQIFLPDTAPQVSKKKTTNGSMILSGGFGGSFSVPKGPKFIGWPVIGGTGGTVSQCFYYGGHDGIDITPLGTGSNNPKVVAAANGRVTYAGIHCTPGMAFRSVCGGYAWVVEIDHGNGFSTIYGHLQANSITVRVGDTVQRGQQIARMGNTGTVYGNPGTHTHFQVNAGGFLGKSTLRAVDPIPYMYNPPSMCN